MKALLDQNLSFRIVQVLLSRFPGTCHVRDKGLTGDDDERIWELAKADGFFIVTKDNDFLARALVRGHPPQVVQIRLGNASTEKNVSRPTGSRCSCCGNEGGPLRGLPKLGDDG